MLPSLPFNQDCLTLRLSALGDAILVTGVLHYWHATRGLHFHVVTRPALAPVFAHHPAVRSVITVDQPNLRIGPWIRTIHRLTRSYGQLPFVDLHGTLRTRILSLLWPGAVFRYPKFSLTRRLFLMTRQNALSSRLCAFNVPQRYSMALDPTPPARASLRPVLFITDEERRQARIHLDSLGLTRPLALHPYATHPAKSPQARVWQNVVRSLQMQGQDVLILGRNATPLLPDSPCDLTNRTDLRQTAAILQQCRGLVTGDSGPMHLATATGTPVIALFGPTTPEWGFYPSGPGDIIFQSPCPDAPCSLHGQDTCTHHHACMNTITPDIIANLLQSLPQ